MAQYAFKCKQCGETREVTAPFGHTPDAPTCHEGPMLRDYRREGVSVDAAVGSIRRDIATTDKAEALRNDFLPTQDDFLKKHGGNKKRANKEIRDWNERHEPADSKGNVYRPKEII